MHGQPSLRKTLQRTRHVAEVAKYKQSGRTYVDIGSWRLEENDNGDLVVRNFVTQQHVILIRREDGAE